MMSGSSLIGRFQEFIVYSFIQACDLRYASVVVSGEKLDNKLDKAVL